MRGNDDLSLSVQNVCPACDYSLAGLPDEHRCPECGFAYSREMLVWRQRSTYWRWHALLHGLMLAGGMVGWLWSGVASIFIVFGLYGLAVAWFYEKRARGRIVICDDEIRILREGGAPSAVPLDQVQGARADLVDASIWLRGHQGETVYLIRADLIGRRRRAKLLVSAINERIERRQGSQQASVAQ